MADEKDQKAAEAEAKEASRAEIKAAEEREKALAENRAQAAKEIEKEAKTTPEAAVKAASQRQPQTKIEQAAEQQLRAKGVASVAPHDDLSTVISETVAHEAAARRAAVEAGKDRDAAQNATRPEGFGQGTDAPFSGFTNPTGDAQVTAIIEELHALKNELAATKAELAEKVTLPDVPAAPQLPGGLYQSGMGAIPVSPLDTQAARVAFQAQSELAGRKLRTNEAPNGTRYRVPQVNPVTGQLIGYLIVNGKGEVLETGA